MIYITSLHKVRISEKIERNEIVELLRKISLPISLLNNKHHLNKVGLIGDLKLASNIVHPVIFLIYILKIHYSFFF